MIFSSAAEIRLKQFLGDDFQIEFSPDYGSQNLAHRRLIRENIISKFGQDWSPSEKEIFLNLDRLPKMLKNFVSISHTVDCGVWIVGPQEVGIDLEQTSRISEKLVKRVCEESEILSAKKQVASYQALWTAKESAFKALYQSDPVLVLSQIEILWPEKAELSKGVPFEVSHKKINKKKPCKGFAILSDFHALSVTILNH